MRLAAGIVFHAQQHVDGLLNDRLRPEGAMPTRLRAANGTYAMKLVRPLVHVCFALWLAACGGGDLAIGLPGEDPEEDPDRTLRLEFQPGIADEHGLPRISGGVPPYEASIEDCPDWVTLLPDQGILAGTAPVSESGRTFFCTYVVTDSAVLYGPQTRSFGLRLDVASPTDLGLSADPISPLSLNIGEYYQSDPLPYARGGVPPYTYSFTCAGGELPAGMGFAPETRVFAGIPEARFHDSCTYTATDSSQPPMSHSLAVEVSVDPLDQGGRWRFRTRTVDRSDHPLDPEDTDAQPFVTLPQAFPALGAESDTIEYDLLDLQPPLSFEASTRVLSYTHGGADPVFDTPTTFRYQVSSTEEPSTPNSFRVQDTLCVDVAYRDPPPRSDLVIDSDGLLSTVRVWVRDDAYWDGTRGEYRCPDTPPLPPAPGGLPSVSNPVHSALAPVHGRRAVNVAHTAIRDRVRNWSPEAPHKFAVSPSVDFASLSGQTDGFDYTGSSQSLSAGADLGAGSWQAGLVAAFTRTDLRYRAAARLSEFGYQAGEHDTEIFSVHPFAAWHAPSRGHLWASLGAGLGDLRHLDDLGFPSWSSSDVELRAYAAGASVPLAEVLSGELDAEAGIESFAFDIKGGDRISTTLPTLRGRDYRAGLAWRAPVRGAPSVSLAYRQLTGDGPEGGQVVLGGSVSASGILDTRLTLTGSAEASFGLGDHEQDQDSLRLGGGIRFAPDDLGRGLNLDTRLFSPAEGYSAGIGVRGEAGYGLWGGPVLGVVSPYVGLVRYPGDGAIRRAVGLNLGDTSTSLFKVEVYDYDRDQSPALKLAIRHRF